MKNKIIKSVLFQLFRKDMLSFWRLFPSKLLDTLIFFVSNALVWGYITPQQNTSASYGPFLIVGAIVSFGLIEVVMKVSLFIADIEGERTISSLLILPVNSKTLLGYTAIFWATSSAMLSVLLFPIGKLILQKQFSLENVSYFPALLMFISANLFYGFFALWMASLVKKLHALEWLWARVIGPMWMFGAYFYSWEGLNKLSPPLALINLINPMVYIMEGMRGAVLGYEGYLPFWSSLALLWVFILGCASHGIYRLKKRLDCI